MSRKLKFIADTMLGSLARWLRMLGYDTLYSRDYSDKEILELASKDSRIILTRDLSLHRKAQKRNLRSIYLENETIQGKLTLLALKLKINLELNPDNSRCPICNGILVRASKEDVLNRVPEKIIELHENFWICTSCGKVYWKGKHWITMNKILSEVRERITHEREKSGCIK